jgi:serine/threonine-protein kinase
MSPLASGVRLHDRFTLRDRVGVGGMSQVWRAEDEVLGRLVAVKVLTTPLAADPLLRAATWTEARAAARLAHPHVTQVYDYGEAALPGDAVVAYLVMELVEGRASRIGCGSEHCPGSRRPPSPLRSPRRWPPPTASVWCIATSSPAT